MSKSRKPPLFGPDDRVSTSIFELDDVLDRVADRLISTMKKEEEKSAKQKKSKKKRSL